MTASIYYKEDELPKLWDATDFSQVNPQVTDETGLYQWDVPMGQWQVRFEKRGYEPTQTEWLPVPPPQLEINIPMAEAVAPTVTKAKGVSSGIKLDFSKYMKPATLGTTAIGAGPVPARINVTRNGADESGTLELLDAEENPYTMESYASKVKFVPQTLFQTTDKVVVTVKKEVESYAGKAMTEDFVVTVPIEPELTAIIADSLVVVNYMDSTLVSVQALPAEAAKGRTLRVESTSPLIASVCKEDRTANENNSLELTLDDEGCASLLVGGELPGSGALRLSVVDADLEQLSLVEVVRPTKTVKAPKASKRSGSLTEEGYQLVLTSQTAGATIYYTFDGSCPCNEQTRKQYTSPIVLSGEGDVEIRAIAVREGMDDSDVQTFRYTVTKGLHMPLTEGWNWVSYPLASMVRLSQVTGGSDLTDVSRVMSQTQEVICDPVYGWVGNLTGLLGGQSYKVLAANPRDVVLTEGTLFNDMTLQLLPGWNWTGYTCLFSAPLEHALKTTDAEEGDVIYGQGRFATYSDGQWTGTLTELAPGKGYMYKSVSAKALTYNAAKPSESRLSTTTRNTQEVPWQVDVTRYAEQTAVIGMLYCDGQRTAPRTVGAFCGTECRGVSTTVGQQVYLTISGRSGELITLRTLEADGTQRAISEMLRLDGDLHGTPRLPIVLTVTDEVIDAISGVTIDGERASTETRPYTTGGRHAVTDSPRNGEVYVRRGQKLTGRK